MNREDQHGLINSGMDLTGTWSNPNRSAIEGFVASQRQASIAAKLRVMEATRLYHDCLTGRMDPVFMREAVTPRNPVFVEHLMQRYPNIYKDQSGRRLGLRETMSVTDYKALYVDVLDRLYYGTYNAYPIVNKGLVKMHTLRDFRVVSRYLLDGVVTPLTQINPAALPTERALLGPSPQDGAYPANDTSPLQYQPEMFSASTSVNWRAIVNDDLGIFRDLALRLGIAGNRGISKAITQTYVDANGPNAALYNAGFTNLINLANGASINNPSFGAQGVMDAIKVLARMRDSGGDPILATGRLRCWYGPANVAAANNLKNMLSLYLSVEGGSQNAQGFPTQFMQTANWINDMDLVMDPYIPIVCTTATTQDTMWGITVDPDSQARPCVEFGMLQGFETPVLLSELPNTQRVGGGVDPTLGNFWTMNQNMKIITVMGKKQIDGRTTVASTGRNA